MGSKVTLHGEKRFHERTNVDYKSNVYVGIVQRNGKTKYEYKGEFFQYLLTRYQKGNCLIKVYKDNVYIMAKNSKRLITTYPVPKKFLPLSNYEIDRDVIKVIGIINQYDGRHLYIELNNNTNYYGEVYKDENVPLNETFLILEDESIISINGDEVKKIISNLGEVLFEKMEEKI